jgi:hypothetical protein
VVENTVTTSVLIDIKICPRETWNQDMSFDPISERRRADISPAKVEYTQYQTRLEHGMTRSPFKYMCA